MFGNVFVITQNLFPLMSIGASINGPDVGMYGKETATVYVGFSLVPDSGLVS
jgi:hypothetical protein